MTDNTKNEMSEKQREILTLLATDYSDNTKFLNKVNKLTFGLLKGDFKHTV